MISAFGTGPPPAAYRVIRLITMLVVIVGGTYLAVTYYKTVSRRAGAGGEPPSRSEAGTFPPVADNDTGGKEYVLDTRTSLLVGKPDNITVARPSLDNASEVAAIVGLESIRDGATIESLPLYYLIREVEERKPADDLLMKQVALVTLAELRADPDRFRAKPVAVRGTIIRVEKSSLPENPSGIREVLDGDLLVGREGICMFLASRLAPVRENQYVEIRGLFMKLIRYSAKGNRQEDAPLIITSHPVLIRTAGDDTERVFPTSLVTILAVLVVAYFALMFVIRYRRQGTNRQLEARRKAKELLARVSKTREETQEETREEAPEEEKRAEQ
jgi:hypothetical protein